MTADIRDGSMLAILLAPLVILSVCGSPCVAEEPSTDASRVQSLDGQWHIHFDPADAGKSHTWFDPRAFPLQDSRPVPVPGSMYDVDPSYFGVFWCMRRFEPTVPGAAGLRHYLRFGAVGYFCEAWLNGTFLGAHEGSQSPFEFDVTDSLLAGKPNAIVVRIAGPYGTVIGGISGHVTLVAQP
jgi:beta-galactosidase/beta-glucuronidase